MNKNGISVVAFGVGLTCAVLLVWLWREEQSRAREEALRADRSRHSAAPAEREARASSALDANTQSLLARLQQALSRGDARTREAHAAFWHWVWPEFNMRLEIMDTTLAATPR